MPAFGVTSSPEPSSSSSTAPRGADPEHFASRESDTGKREQRHPATFQCTICSKCFTRANNLRSHLKSHDYKRQYVCQVCGKTFVREYDRKRHERLHSGEEKFVCKGDLKLGGEWGCGRRFVRADALGHHFRSDAGRVCIKPLWDEEWAEEMPQSKTALGTDGPMIDPALDSTQKGGFALPTSLLAQYPALARWPEGEPKSSDNDVNMHSDYSDADDSRQLPYSETAPYGRSWLESSEVKEQESRTLEDHTAEEFARQFAECLVFRSGAYTWSGSSVERLSYEAIISELNTALTIYTSLSRDKTPSGVHSGFRKAIDDTRDEICRRFCEEMTLDFSTPEVLHSHLDIGATQSLTKQNAPGESTEDMVSRLLASKSNHQNLLEGNTVPGVSYPTELSANLTQNDPLTAISSSKDEDRCLKKLKSLLNVTNEPKFNLTFEWLCQRVRNKLYLNPMQSMQHVTDALFIQRIGTPFLSDLSEFIVETNFGLLDYVKQNFPEQRVGLATLVTITGTAFYAYATTCSEYLKRTWAGTEDILLPLIQEAIQKVFDQPDSTAMVTKELYHFQATSVELRGDGTLKLHVQGPGNFVVDVVQQLCWLNAAFSAPPASGEVVTYCTPTMDRIVDSALTVPTFRLNNPFTELTADEKSSCWLSLFQNPVIAHGFLIPKRADGVGLEMSVELMAAIVGARHAAVYDGGVVIKGFSSMFLPVRRTKDGIQWHYIANSDPEMQLSYEEGVRQCPNRSLLSDVQLASLAIARCFIGWNSTVEVRMGDENTDFDSIEFSDAGEVKSTLQIPTASIGFQQFGLAQIDVTFGKRDGKCHFQRSSSYRRIIAASERMFIALFDTGERRGCLVTASGLLLHALRHRMSSGLGGVPESKVRIESARGFTETLLKNAKLRISSEEDEPLFLDDVVSEIWSVLELLQAQTISTEKTSGLEIHSYWQERLLGYEYRAVVEDWSPMPLKELEIRKTCGGWPKLIRDVNALVLFANCFGDLIRPIDDQKTLCNQWKTLPPNMDYMAVPVNVLLDLYSLAGCRQTRKRLTATNLQLTGGGVPLFRPCPTPKERQCSCDRLQQVVSNSSFGLTCAPELLEVDGAVIIGKSEGVFRIFTVRRFSLR